MSLNSTRVSYNNSQVLKCSANFSYDRYICGESSSLARALGINLNNRRFSKGAGPGDNRTYNSNNALNEVASGISLLNSNTRYTVNLPSNGYDLISVGSRETRLG